MYKWSVKRESIFYKSYLIINKIMESTIVRSSVFSVAAGGQLVQKYKDLGANAYPTTPRMTLTPQDIFERDDTCKNEIITLVNVGGLIHDKAQHNLLRSFAIAYERDKRLRLRIIGEGPKKEYLVGLSKDLQIESVVEFVGYIESEQVLYNQLQNSDVFVLSSITEGFPRALYEAMAMRLPIVTTNVGGIPNLLTNEENALLVNYGENNDLADAIIKMVSDEILRKNIIKNSSQTLNKVFEGVDFNQISS